MQHNKNSNTPFKAEICCVESESDRKKEQFVALLTDCVVHKQF
jgi:hypothetical protein